MRLSIQVTTSNMREEQLLEALLDSVEGLTYECTITAQGVQYTPDFNGDVHCIGYIVSKIQELAKC